MAAPTTEPDRTLQLTLTAEEADVLLGLLNRTVNALWDAYGDLFGRAIWKDELDADNVDRDLDDIPY